MLLASKELTFSGESIPVCQYTHFGRMCKEACIRKLRYHRVKQSGKSLCEKKYWRWTSKSFWVNTEERGKMKNILGDGGK